MQAAVATAILAVAVAGTLGVVLLRGRARLAQLEALQRVGPLALSRQGEQNQTARAVHDGWAQVFQQMIYSASDVFWETDAAHRYERILYRDHAHRNFDFDALLKHAPWEYPAVGVTDESWARLRDDMDHKRTFHEFIVGRTDSNGTLRFSCISGVAVFGADGTFVGYRGASRDYTQIRQTQLQLEIRDAVTRILAGAARLSEALPGILEAVCKPLGWHYGARWMRDTRNNTLLCGETWSAPIAQPLAHASRARRFPITAHDLISRAWTTQVLATTLDVGQDIDYNRREQALESGLHSAFAFPVVVQGEVVCVLEFLGPHVQQADVLIETLASSLGSQLALFWLRREAEARLTYAATHDALTGLRNRLSFNAELDRAIQRAKRNGWRLALMFVDLDGFKQVNDRLGHHAGDAVLIEIAKRLKNSLRSSDSLARMGGDEFVVLLEQTGTDGEIAEVAQKLVAVISAPFDGVDTAQTPVSASFGVAIYPVDAQDQQGLLAHADSAMYRAKESRENRVVFYRPPSTELPVYNRSLDVSAAIDAAANSMPATDAPTA
jgi:diguanylate cyclase (GGDEF)-like protein